MSKLQRRIITGVVLGVVVYAAMLLMWDAERLMEHVSRFPLLIFAGALGLTLVNYALRFAKWHLYLCHLDIDLPLVESATLFVAGMVMAVTPGKVGEVVKSLLLRESRGISVARTAPVVVAERVTDLLGMVVIAGFGIVTFQLGRAVFAATVVLLAAFVLVLNQRQWVEAILDASADLPLVGGLEPKLREAYDSMHMLVGWRILGATTLLSVAAWSMEGVALWWIIGGLEGGEATLYLAFFIYSISTILGSVSFLPGGLGVAEGVMIVALLRFGVVPDDPAAVMVTYAIRFATLWFGVAAGLVALVGYRMRYIPEEPPGAEPPESGAGSGAP